MINQLQIRGRIESPRTDADALRVTDALEAEITADQHFGLRLFERDGQTWAQFRVAGHWGAALPWKVLAEQHANPPAASTTDAT